MAGITTFPASPTPAQDFIQFPNSFPAVPEEIKERFDSASEWDDAIALWYRQLGMGLGEANDSVSGVVNQVKATTDDLIVTSGELRAMIITETDARITADEVLARRIVTVSALAGSSSNIKVQNTPPGGPVLNDLWVDNADPLNPITYRWSGAAWVEVTDPISVAAVAAEQSARITADGYLEGKYTLTVIAGNVVTGMNITSASGSGTNISSVIFRATDFQIYNSVLGVAMFTVSGTNVNLANVLTVSTSGKVFTGTGTYGNANTYFYVDSSNRFSLGANLTWDGATLTITGSISATTGTIGGWTVGATTLTGGNATLDSAGQLFLGTANNVVYLSATDATYRLWIGNVTAGSATFSVTKAGALFSTSGTIGGFTIGSNSLTAGSGSTAISLSNSAGTGINLGNTAARYLQLYVTGNVPIVNLYNGSNTVVASLAVTAATESGILTLYSSVGSTITLIGSSGSIIATSVSANLSGSTNYAAGNLTGSYAALDGSAITTLNASNISSGTLNNSRLPSAISVTTLTASGVVNAGSGSNSAPGYGFGAGTNYGMYLSGTNLSFTTSGTLRGYFDTSYNFVVTNGTVNMLVSIDTGSSRGLIGTGTNHTLEVVTNSAVVWFFGSDGHFKSNGGDIRKVSSDSWTVKLYDGTSELEFQASGGQIYGRINGGGAILLG